MAIEPGVVPALYGILVSTPPPTSLSPDADHLIGAFRVLAAGNARVLAAVYRQFQTDEAAFRQALKRAKPEREEALQMTLAQEWMARGEERGMAKGIAQGIAQGVAQGAAQAHLVSVVDILEARFGPLDAKVRERLATLDAQGLRPLVRRALAVHSAAELLEEPGEPH